METLNELETVNFSKNMNFKKVSTSASLLKVCVYEAVVSRYQTMN